MSVPPDDQNDIGTYRFRFGTWTNYVRLQHNYVPFVENFEKKKID